MLSYSILQPDHTDQPFKFFHNKQIKNTTNTRNTNAKMQNTKKLTEILWESSSDREQPDHTDQPCKNFHNKQIKSTTNTRNTNAKYTKKPLIFILPPPATWSHWSSLQTFSQQTNKRTTNTKNTKAQVRNTKKLTQSTESHPPIACSLIRLIIITKHLQNNQKKCRKTKMHQHTLPSMLLYPIFWESSSNCLQTDQRGYRVRKIYGTDMMQELTKHIHLKKLPKMS